MNLSFNILKAKDDINSINNNLSNAIVKLDESLNEFVNAESPHLHSSELNTIDSPVLDDEGNPVDFNKASLRELLDIPTVATAIAQSFFESIAGAKRKN